MIKRLWTILFGIFMALYPFLIYLGLTKFNIRAVALFVLFFVTARIGISSGFSFKKIKPFLPLLISGISLSFFSLIFKNEEALLLLPVFTSLVFFATFGLTLIKGVPMIERFAALKEKKMTLEIKRYCFNVTVIWTLFFAINAIVAFYTVFYTSKEYWMLYNGLISYILIGTIFAVEYIVRRIIKVKSRL
ncbi:MAG: hypothetical protein JXR91_17835 [Deltaproteobacteria bacterium]|nr:hypothetical protein [Deltaproteobacteria bacterium]